MSPKAYRMRTADARRCTPMKAAPQGVAVRRIGVHLRASAVSIVVLRALRVSVVEFNVVVLIAASHLTSAGVIKLGLEGMDA